ncbi:unnamed protein product, partial [Tenebrio molitor]
MDFWGHLYALKNILPEITLNSVEVKKVGYLNLGQEEKIVRILSDHFNKKKLKCLDPLTQRCLEDEAYCIHRVFPSVTLEHIKRHLEIFKDLPNRTEIVLRLITYWKRSKNGDVEAMPLGIKRTNVHIKLPDNANNKQSIKVRKLTDLTAPTAKLTVIKLPNHATAIRPQGMQATTSLIPPQTAEHAIPQIEDLTPTQIAALYFPLASDNLENLPLMRQEEFLTTKKSTPTCTVTSSSEVPTEAEQGSSDSDLDATAYCVKDYIRRFEESLPDIADVHEENHVPSNSHSPIADNSAISSVEDLADVNNEETYSPISNYLRVRMDIQEDAAARNVEITNDVHSSGEKDDQEASAFAATPDSNQTEFYSPDWETIDSGPLPVANFFTIDSSAVQREINENKVVGNEEVQGTMPSIPSGLSVEPATLLPKRVTVSNNIFFGQNLPCGSFKQEVSVNAATNVINIDVNNIPSTSKQIVQDKMDVGDADFNLLEYLRDITEAPEDVIRRHCKKLNISLWKKPPTTILNSLVNHLIPNTISSDSSYSDDDSINFVASFARMVQPVEASTSLQQPCVVAKKPHVDPSAKKPHVDRSPKKPPECANSNSIVCTQLVNHLCNIFPDACPDYVRTLCKGKSMDDVTLDQLITVILNANNEYPKRPRPTPEADVFPENQLEILKEFLPDADPDYLAMMCDRCEGKPEMVKAFINKAMEERNYPTMKDYLRRQQISAQQKQYTTDFTVENFIKVIPDPDAFFSDPSRNLKLDAASSHYALVFLRNTFNRLPLRVIQSVFTKNSSQFSKTVEELKSLVAQKKFLMKSYRRPIPMPKNIHHIPLLQEIAYYSHEQAINKYLLEMKQKEETEREEAKNKGLLKTCSCCYDDEVLPKDIYCCENKCEFCKSCIIKSTEVRFGEGKLDFPCLLNCSSSFSLQILQAVLSPKLFSKVAQKKALEEIKSAGIEELEMCPFCDFATIPAEGYNIFTCLNPECMKESCRMCKEPSHVPLRCDEIEKDEDVRARTFVENKMTEALLRKCWKCGVKFFKEEGCNKMTCSCGAQMCYVCGQPVKSYKHFNGNGGDRYDLCPLYSDSNVLNKENVLKGAEEAKAAIGNVALKHDPTKDVQQYYEQRSAKVPQQHLLV